MNENHTKHIAIIGTGIGGLMSAIALQKHGIRTTLLERDIAPDDTISPVNSWDWVRKGVPQSVHPHFFMGRLRVLLEEQHPRLVEALFQAGASESTVTDYVHPDVAHRFTADPTDDRLRTINCRRTTFEMVVRKYASSLEGIDIKSRSKVTDVLLTDASPKVAYGLKVEGEHGAETLEVDGVIDASGRSSKLAETLKDKGVEFDEDQRDSGIWYFTRHYQLKPGCTAPSASGLPGAQFEDFTVGALPSDNGHFTITFQVYRKDNELAKALRDPDHFQYVCANTSQTAPWVDPDRAVATSKVHGFGQMDSFWRKIVAGGKPQLLNYYFVGDSCLRSNPKYGRGCTWSSLSAHHLADLLATDLAPDEIITRYEEFLEESFRRDWTTMRNIDRSTERGFAIATGEHTPSLSERVQKYVQYFGNDAIVVEPELFRDLWTGYNGFQHMDAWAKRPINALRMIRAWLQRRSFQSIIDSQRGRLSHSAMSTSSEA